MRSTNRGFACLLRCNKSKVSVSGDFSMEKYLATLYSKFSLLAVTFSKARYSQSKAELCYPFPKQTRPGRPEVRDLPWEQQAVRKGTRSHTEIRKLPWFTPQPKKLIIQVKGGCMTWILYSNVQYKDPLGAPSVETTVAIAFLYFILRVGL